MFPLLNKFKRIDWSLVLILLAFMVISTFLIYSATISSKYADMGFHKKNLVFYAVGFVALFGVALFNFRWLLKSSIYLYAIGLILLAGLYTPLGKVYFGARGWYTIPGLNMDFQPAELVKLILIITIAAYIGRREGEKLELLRDVIPIGVIVAVPFAMVVLMPDLGNAIIFIVILLGMYWIGNIKFLHVLIGTTLVAGSIGLFVFLFSSYHDEVSKVMEAMGGGHWVQRFDSFLSPETSSRDTNFQGENSKIAIGSGNLTGNGYLKGTSVHSNFIPVAYSDAIFVVVGEEFGFRGAVILLVLYFIMIYRMIIISMETEDLRGSYIIVGIVSLYVFQIFENVGMLIGLMPITGITLPFVSYGGTSLLINMVAIGLVMSIRVHQEKPDELE
ncbi:FtsW/RodA/SpoVE family cell cycle protein [Paenibacillus sp. CC-CFT747]|nr:FtsW/RodA/SpoVE family cell cycle protein [Paenibacillus sp. CC-CFT747]